MTCDDFNEGRCPLCAGPIWGVEYADGPDHYDGISEYRCRGKCQRRWGRWSGRELAPGEWEGRWGRHIGGRALTGEEWED